MTIYDAILQKNEITRKRWLQYSLFYFLCYPIFLVLSILIPSPTEEFTVKYFESDEFSNLMLFLFVHLVLFGSLYYFSYKKNGTKLLTFLIFLFSFQTISFPKQIVREFKADFGSLDMYASLLNIVLLCGWYVLTWQLRRTNQRLRLLKQYPDDVKECLDTIQEASSKDELNSKFYNLIQKHPLIELIISLGYQLKIKTIAEN